MGGGGRWGRGEVGGGEGPWAKTGAGAGLVHSLNPDVYFLSFYPQLLSLKNSLRVHAAASNREGWGVGKMHLPLAVGA